MLRIHLFIANPIARFVCSSNVSVYKQCIQLVCFKSCPYDLHNPFYFFSFFLF